MSYRGLPARDPRAFRFVELPPEEGGRLAESGFVIAWPYGEPWSHDHVAQEPAPATTTDTEVTS